MSLYEQTVARLRAAAERAVSTDDAIFCEQRPLTSLEAELAGAAELADRLRACEDEALAALAALVEAERGYETALRSIDDAGAEASVWLRAVTLARSLGHVGASG